jgi:hypothetical protein
MSYTESKILNLNSSYAIKNNGSFLSDVFFNFNGILKEDPDILEINLSLQSAQIPYSFYNINVYNNKLDLTYNSILYNIVLTRGNYNANSLLLEIQTQLINNSITDLTIVISSITGLLTFTSANYNYTINSTSTILKVLGFDANTSYSSTLKILNAPYPLNLLGSLNVKIVSSDLIINNIDSSVGGNYSIICNIPIEAPNFGIILYDNITNLQSKLNNVTLDGFDLKLFDDDNNLINFNNQPWTVQLVLNITRKRIDNSITTFKNIISPIYDLINNSIEKSNNDNSNNDNSNNNNIDNSNSDNNNIDNSNNDLNNNIDNSNSDNNDLDILLYNKLI